jgi:hypothetical protein
MSLRPSLQRIALSLAVALPCTIAAMDGADAQRATPKAVAPKSAPAGNETDRVLDGAAKSLEAGNADAAMTALEGILAGGGLSNSHMARALYLRGLAHRKKGRPAQAIADLTSAVWLKDGLNEKDRAAALNARGEVSREVGVAAPASSDGGSSAPRSAPAASVAATPETAVRTRTAAAPRSMAEDLSEAGFTRSFKPTAPAAEPAPAPAATSSGGPATSSWQSATTIDAKERARPAAPRQQVSAAPAAPPAPETTPSGNRQPASGGGLGSFFTGLFTGTPSATSAPPGDAGGKSQSRPRAEQWVTTEKPAASKAGKDAAPIATSAVPSGAFRLQIATVRSRKEADAVAARVRKEHAGAVGRRQLEIDETVFGGMGTFYRVRLGPYANMNEPKALCDQLRPQGYDCLVVTN